MRNLILPVAVLLAASPAFANELTNGRITVDFATGGGTQTMDRVDAISWIDSDGVSTGNLAVAGGGVNCGDPQEFFGQAYSDLDGGTPLFIVQGSQAKWKPKGDAQGTSKANGKDDCLTLNGKTTSVYTLGGSSKLESAMKIERTFTFGTDGSANLRAYAPRVSMSVYATVVYANGAGDIQTFPITNCPFATASGCEISDWNGKWVADEDSAGAGVVLIRDKSSKWPAEIAADFDSFSASNVTAIILMRPEAGWTGKVKETEYLCFYDAKSWTAKSRAKGKLPDGCQVK
jgi:hypothetical protein